MPKVEGSYGSVQMTKKHRFHGIAGMRNKKEMMTKYLKMSFKQTKIGFEVTLKNEAKHNLLLHPLRLGLLKVKVISDSKVTNLKPIPFFRILGTKGKPSMPWLATEVVKENMLKADEIKTYKYDTLVKDGDKVGYYYIDSSGKVELKKKRKRKIINM